MHRRGFRGGLQSSRFRPNGGGGEESVFVLWCAWCVCVFSCHVLLVRPRENSAVVLFLSLLKKRVAGGWIGQVDGHERDLL